MPKQWQYIKSLTLYALMHCALLDILQTSADFVGHNPIKSVNMQCFALHAYVPLLQFTELDVRQRKQNHSKYFSFSFSQRQMKPFPPNLRPEIEWTPGDRAFWFTQFGCHKIHGLAFKGNTVSRWFIVSTLTWPLIIKQKVQYFPHLISSE